MTHALFLFTAYLFVGSILMLIVNELSPLSERQFLRGMTWWPIAIAVWLFFFVRAYVRRALRG